MKVVQTLKSMKHPYALFTHRDIKTDIKALRPHYEHLLPDEYLQKRLKLTSGLVMRQRRMIDYDIEFDGQGNIVKFHEQYNLGQYVEKQKLQYAKLYPEFTSEMKNDQNFKDFLYNTLQITWQLKNYTKGQISVHAVRTISYENQPASPTPEGPHQDGVDLEVIAVVNKKNCQGAETQIFSPDKQNLLFEMTLDPGEGYILDGQNLWNYANDHQPVDPSKVAVRDIIGYLLKIQE